MTEKRHTANHKIIITVSEIQGICTSGLKVGDKIVIRWPRMVVRETDNVCVNALSALVPYIRQWSRKPFPSNARSYVCCPDPGPGKGGKGHVFFHIESEKIG